MTLESQELKNRLGLGPNPTGRLAVTKNTRASERNEAPDYERRRRNAAYLGLAVAALCGKWVYDSIKDATQAREQRAVIAALIDVPSSEMVCETIIVQPDDIALGVAREIASEYPDENPRIEDMATKILRITDAARGDSTLIPGDRFSVCYNPGPIAVVDVFRG